MSLLIVATILGLARSTCNVATVTGEYQGSVSLTAITSLWSSQTAYQIPAEACVSLFIQNAAKFSGKWVCKKDSNGQGYMKYEIFSGVTDCSGSAVDTSDITQFFDTLTSIAANIYDGAYVFQNVQQAQSVLQPTIFDLANYQLTKYYTGTISCGEPKNCGTSITQTLYSNTNACDGDIIAETSLGNLVSGFCAASVNAQLNLDIDCTQLKDMGYDLESKISFTNGICSGPLNAQAQFSMGYVCKEGAIWLLGYDQANCQGSYSGLKIQPTCYTSGLGSYQLNIKCDNPNYPGNLNFAYGSGDKIELDEYDFSNSNKVNVLLAIFSSLIVFILYM